jgi:eukaryotic-like serine/threonine-protein kinase
VTVAEGYTELNLLGSGASGSVVLARHDATGQLVAIKHLSPALARDDRFRARFRGEAEILRRLSHPNIAGLHWYRETAAEAVLAMELVDGVPLRRVLDQGPTVPEAALVVLRGSLRGLEHAHVAGIVHRDYKPENVIVDADGNSRLIDFGIAAPVGADTFLAGTPRYMAPEQWQGGSPTPQTDVYAATAVFFECLTGRRAFDADTLTQLRQQHLHDRIPVEAVPGPVQNLVAHGLAKEPSDRYPTAGVFLEELEAAAIAGYGVDWVERGTKALAEAALALAALFPLAAGAGASAGATTLATTVMGSGGRGAGTGAGGTAGGAAGAGGGGASGGAASASGAGGGPPAGPPASGIGDGGWRGRLRGGLGGWPCLVPAGLLIIVGATLGYLAVAHAGPFGGRTSTSITSTGPTFPILAPATSSVSTVSASPSTPTPIPSNAAIGGEVVNDANGNGSLDAGETGIPNVTVVLSQSGGRLTTTATDRGGAYAFSGLAAGTYTIDYRPPAGFVNTGSRSLTLSLSAGQTATKENFFAQQRNASISGEIVNDANGNGSLDPGEAGIGAVVVTVVQGRGTGTGAGATTRTDSSGMYSFAGLAAGTYTLDYTAPPGFVNTGKKPVTVTLTVGQAVTGVNGFAQQRNAAIAGTVWNDNDTDGPPNNDGEIGISGVTVTLIQNNTTLTTTTDARGAYSFAGLAAGNYTVTVSLPPGYFADAPTSLNVTLAAGQMATGEDFYAHLG